MTLGATAVAAVASQGNLNFYTQGNTDSGKKYIMCIDDITVTENPIKIQSFENATNDVIKEVVGGSAKILEGTTTIKTDSSSVTYYNRGAYTGNNSVMFENNNANGVGLLKIYLTDKQIADIKNGGEEKTDELIELLGKLLK